MIYAFAFLLGCFLAPDACDDTLSGFETGSFAGWFEEFPEPYSGAIVSDPVRCGRFAARFEIRHNDEYWLGGHRSEVHEFWSKAPYGTPIWYGFSTFIPEHWPPLRNRTVIAQWHGTPDQGEAYRSPPLAIRYSGGTLEITSVSSGTEVQAKNDGTRMVLYRDDGKFRKGAWNDWVFEVVWSWSGDGRVRAWLNGTRVVDYHGPVGYRDEKGPWFKFGIYRDNHEVTQVLYHDEYKRGGSFEAVDPANCAG